MTEREKGAERETKDKNGRGGCENKQSRIGLGQNGGMKAWVRL